MSHPRTPAAYPDVERAFRLAREIGSAIQPMPDGADYERRRAAIRWRQRAYTYRSLLRQASETGTSVYDNLLIRIDDGFNCVITTEANAGMPAPLAVGEAAPTGSKAPDIAEIEVPDFDAIRKEFKL